MIEVKWLECTSNFTLLSDEEEDAVLRDYGQRGVFSVDIALEKTVGHLKIAIKQVEVHENMLKSIDANNLELFHGGMWLEFRSDHVQQLREGGTTHLIDSLTQKNKELLETSILENVLANKYTTDPLAPEHIHVLVKIPKAKRSRQREADDIRLLKQLKLRRPAFLETSDRNGPLPSSGDFVRMFEWDDDDCGTVKDIGAIKRIANFTGSQFYVRKEILCVLENFHVYLQDKLNTDALTALDKTKLEFGDQFIITGSPGTGKSCILALICFYLAIVKKVPVVWYRRDNGGNIKPVTRLFYEGVYYEWDSQIGELGKTYETLHRSGNGFDTTRCWFCLDGLTQNEIYESGYQNYYTLLATSLQFTPKGEGGDKQLLCLLPYWKQIDLEDMSLKMRNRNESSFARRFFVSGGSIRQFLLPINVAERCSSWSLRRITSADANLLVGRGQCTADYIDNVRMMGVVNTSDAQEYLNLLSWRSCVTSMMVMEHLKGQIQPTLQIDFFEKLLVTAKELGDRRLQAVALEQFISLSSILELSEPVGGNKVGRPQVADN